MWALRAALSLLALWALVRAIGVEAGYPLVALLAFTPYVLAVAVLALAVAACVRRWPEAAVAALLVAVFAALVLPRAFPNQETAPIEGGVELDVLTVNLRLGEADAEAIVGIVDRGDVDLLSVQELTTDEVARLRSAGIDELLPEQELSPTPDGSSGAGLYSRHPLEPLEEVPGGISRMVRALVTVPGAEAVDVVAVHPFPPNSLTTAQWRSGLAALPPADASGPIGLLAGDFNATFDHEVFRDLVATGYVDAAAARGRGLEATWPSARVKAPPVTIDHVLADERVHVAAVEIDDVPGTDHRAVLARLRLPPVR